MIHDMTIYRLSISQYMFSANKIVLKNCLMILYLMSTKTAVIFI